MTTGSGFEDERNPHMAVQVGRPGDAPSIIEIQDMLFTVSGPTAGAILMQWNAQEATKGSMGMWDSHFRVGGAAGSNLQIPDYTKSTGSVDPKCKAASMLLHLTSGSTAYLENTQISVYAARGILIESQRAWLWATSSEHSTLYQYQLTRAKNILMGMIETEPPYYQPVPRAPSRFRIGHFPDDPSFQDCKTDRVGCYSSWALRIIDSSAIYVLGAGLYSWFSDYDQKCVEEDNEALTESICGKSCGKSLADWFNGVEAWCQGYNISRQLPTTRGGRMWAGVNETCVKDSKTGEYCNDIIDKFTEVDRIDEMPRSEDMRQTSDNIYRASKGESTCEKVALKNNLAPAALYNLNSAIHDCGSIPAGTELCLPLACARLVKYSQKSNCTAIEKNEGLSPGSLRRLNPWINRECSNLNSGGNSFGRILCAEPQDGEMPQFGAGDDTVMTLLNKGHHLSHH
ncbi:uncharacterized protein NECHADRAFT_87984 [Fusarium vanettenii 77-13-4]|uniref:LysM domain-containing protein n=1 Tax=Fusarium vanettenii (strain ATCC MYA-4622 / CBS 123669 / FGSC 9596 / NRRL 45880 / 77-13-4) TaxID=660122 RepID=C7ZJZ0_FUSV7|nr:uncharacterized protein NECHADRAFT_87984 [Fusarium vanettenii 77-13-4]EEU35716.1 hypothetical protein NECHADRAFT_87984 [Fusarium vanettenii 77-13-4]